MVFDTAGMEEEAGFRRSPPFRRLQQRTLWNAGDLGGSSHGPLAAVLGHLIETDGELLDECVIDPIAFDHDLQHTGKQCGITTRLDRQIQIARARDRCDAWVLDDDLRALLARLPDV